MVPASVRWMPSTRMSLTTNGSRASAEVANKPATRAGTSFSRIEFFSAEYSGQQAEQIVVQRQRHQRGQKKHARLLTQLQGTVRERAALDNLDRIIQQVSSIQSRDRQ